MRPNSLGVPLRGANHEDFFACFGGRRLRRYRIRFRIRNRLHRRQYIRPSGDGGAEQGNVRHPGHAFGGHLRLYDGCLSVAVPHAEGGPLWPAGWEWFWWPRLGLRSPITLQRDRPGGPVSSAQFRHHCLIACRRQARRSGRQVESRHHGMPIFNRDDAGFIVKCIVFEAEWRSV